MASIWAVARSLIIEVWRMRLLMLFLLMLTLSYTLGLGYSLVLSNDTAPDKLQIFIGWSLRAMQLLAALTTIFISIFTITRDIERRHIHTLVTKPISRLQIMLGKFCGLALFNAVFLLINGLLIFGTTLYLAKTQPESDLERSLIENRTLTALRTIQPRYEDVAEAVKQKVDQIVAAQIQMEQMTDPDQIEKMRKQLTRMNARTMEKNLVTVQTMEHMVWRFRNIQPVDRENGYVFVRYKPELSGGSLYTQFLARWVYGPKDPVLHGGMRVERIATVGEPLELEIPATMVSDEGDLYLMFLNPLVNNPSSVMFPIDKGLEVYYVTGSFGPNLLRTMVAAYLRVLFLAAMGVAIGAWLSYPVAVLMVMFIFVVGNMRTFLFDAVGYDTAELHRISAESILSLIPPLSAFDPVPLIEKSQEVGLGLIARCLLFLVSIYGGIASGIAYVIFRFRELARVIV